MLDRKKIATAIEDNWDQIKDELVVSWDKLTQADVEVMTGFDSLVSQLLKKYSFTEEKVFFEISRLLEKLDLFPVDAHFKELKEALYQSAIASTNKLSRNVQSSVTHFKESSSELYHNTVDYIQDKPLQSVVWAFLGGVIFKSIFRRN